MNWQNVRFYIHFFHPLNSLPIFLFFLVLCNIHIPLIPRLCSVCRLFYFWCELYFFLKIIITTTWWCVLVWRGVTMRFRCGLEYSCSGVLYCCGNRGWISDLSNGLLFFDWVSKVGMVHVGYSVWFHVPCDLMLEPLAVPWRAYAVSSFPMALMCHSNCVCVHIWDRMKRKK